MSKLGCAGLQVNGAVAFTDPSLMTLLSSSPYRTGFPPSGKVGLGGGESVKQLNTSVMFLKKKAKPQTPLITSSPTTDRMEGGDGRTGWTPGRSGTQPWLPYADRAAWTTCRAGRRWHWLRAPCRSGSGWMRTTSYCIDKKTERNVGITFLSVFNAKVLEIKKKKNAQWKQE